jgi:cytochrome c-type biogenesis protein CcmH
MTFFIFLAALCVLLTLAWLLRPFAAKAAVRHSSQRQFNAAILGEQLVKLEQDLADGVLSQADFAPAHAELKRRVLEDTRIEDAAPSLHAPRKTVAALAIALPIAAAALYLAIGNPGGVGYDATAQRAGDQDLERMVQKLADKLARDPANLKGWTMLARSYKVMGRMAEAEQAYQRAGAFIEKDAQLLADYADVVVSNSGGDFAGKPAMLLDKALKIDPDNPMALWLAGTAAFSGRDFEKAVSLWERLVPLLEPGSQDARNVQASLSEARGLAGKPAIAATRALVAAAQGAQGASVSGTVQLVPALKARAAPGDTVMVIARAPGSRIPLAVLRVRATELPLKFTLDDSLAMNAQVLLSDAKEVEVEARISKTGLARAEPGDLVSAVQTVKVGARGVALSVAQVRP